MCNTHAANDRFSRTPPPRPAQEAFLRPPKHRFVVQISLGLLGEETRQGSSARISIPGCFLAITKQEIRLTRVLCIGHGHAQERSASSDRKLSIARRPIAFASPLIKSSPVIQEGRPFVGGTSRMCTLVPRPLLSGAAGRGDEVCQRPGTRGIIALCPSADRYRPRNNRISHYTPPCRPKRRYIRNTADLR